MDEKALAQSILELVGGPSNVEGVTHCASRLRFTLKDAGRADADKLKATEGVLGVVEKGGQLQVVIGPTVETVYTPLVGLLDASAPQAPEAPTPAENDHRSVMARIFDYISGALTPLLPIFAGAGILTAVLIILAGLGVCPADSGQFAVWYAAGHAIFYFLPIFVGFYAAKKLGVTPLVGAIIGAALLEPNFTALQTGDPKSFFSIPIVAVDYSATIVPSLLAVWVTSFLERSLNAHLAKNLRSFLVPAIDLAVMVPLTVLVLGPIGNAVANGAGAAINYLVSANMIVAGIVMGGFWGLLVIFGVHWAIIPIILANLNANGGDPIFALAAASVFACLGVSFGVFLRTKDKDYKTLVGSYLISGILSGVNEPLIYGVIMRYRMLIPMVVVAGAIGGAVGGIGNVQLIVFNFLVNVFTLASFAPIGWFLAEAAVSFVVALVLVLAFGFESKGDTAEQRAEQTATKAA
jgi:PTS system beta-glucosides-specific IIC component